MTSLKNQLEKEIKEQNNKLERIKKAYINGVFKLKEYNEEKKIVKTAIEELQNKLETTDCTEELKFIPKDILLKLFPLEDYTNWIQIIKWKLIYSSLDKRQYKAVILSLSSCFIIYFFL